MVPIQACNITVIMIIYSDHRMAHRKQEVYSKLIISVALSLEVICSAMIWWYRCFGHEVLSQMAVIVIRFVIVALFSSLREMILITHSRTSM